MILENEVEMELERGIQWPAGVPRDYEEMFSKGSIWVKFIQGRLRTLNKVGRNFEDLYQDMVLKLISANVLDKFVQKAMTRLPSEMTTVELCAYIGITLKKLEYLHWRHASRDNPDKKVRAKQCPIWMPTPLRGGKYSKDAVYSRSDVLDFDRLFDMPESGCRRNDGSFAMQKRGKTQTVIVRDQDGEVLFDHDGNALKEKIPVLDDDGNQVMVDINVYVARQTVFAPTGDGFRTYLANALHNHFANFCRTKSRKEKEHLLSPNSVVTGSSDGSFHVSATFEEGSAWESSLADSISHPDELEARIDFADQFKEACQEAGLNTDVLSDYISGLETEGAGPTEAAKPIVDVLDHMAKTGRDLPDAFSKIRGFTLSRELTRRIRGQARKAV